VSADDLARLRAVSSLRRDAVITDATPTLGTETAPDREAYRATVLLLATAGDVVANPTARIVRTGEAGTWGFVWPTSRASGTGPERPLIGETFTERVLVPLRAVPTAPEDRYRRDVVLACASALWELGAVDRMPVTAEMRAARGAGFPYGLAAGVVVTVAGIAAVAWLADDVAVTSIQARTRLDLVRQGATEYAARLRTFRETGTMPPPGPAETVAESTIRERAQSFSERLSGVLSQASNNAKWIGAGVLAALLLSSRNKAE